MIKFAIVLSVIGAFVLPPQLAEAGPLDDLFDRKKLVLLFAKSRSDSTLTAQISRLIDRRPDLEDRDMVVLRTTANRETMAVLGYVRISPGTARALNRKYQPPEVGMTIVLVDEQGDEMARWTGLTDPELIFEAVDNPPENDNEIKDKAGG